MSRYFQLSANGQLHRMEAGHAGAGASNPIPAKLVTLDKYELCNLPQCFGTKHEVGGALKVEAEDPPKAAERSKGRRRVAHGVQADEG